MVNWLCPHCKQRMHSAYDKRGQKVVECIYCNREFENQYYRRDEDGIKVHNKKVYDKKYAVKDKPEIRVS